MAAEIFKLFGTIAVNGLEGVKTELKALDKQLGAMDKALTKFGRQSVKIGTTLTRNLTVPIAAAGFAAFKGVEAASNLAETVSKVGMIFGESGAEIEAWSKTAAITMGQSKQSAMDAAATFAIFGKSAGLAGGDLVKFSTDFSALASDLASFHNSTPEEAIVAIGAALRGEALPLRRFGILLDDATMRAAAFKAGIIQSTKEALTPQQKVLAAQIVIYEQSADAQGDFSRTSSGLANQQRILKAEIANLTADIGTAFLPMALRVVSVFRGQIMPAVQGAVDWFNKLSAETKNNIIIFAGIVAVLGPAILIMGKTILAIKEIATAYTLAKTAAAGLSLAMAANPFTLWIAGVGLLASGLALVTFEMGRMKAAAVEQAKIEGLKKGIEGLTKETRLFGFANIVGAQATTDNSAAVADLAGLARDLGFAFNEANGSEEEQLKKLGEILKTTNSLAEATDKFNKIKAAGKAKPGSGGKGSADEDVIKKRQALESKYADQRAALELSEVEQLDRKYKEELALAQAAGASTVDLTAAYMLEREQIIFESSERTRKTAQEFNDKEKAERGAINAEYKQKLNSQATDQVKVLEAEKVEAIKIAKAKGADVAAVEKYYIKEIQDAKDAAAEKDKDRTLGIVSNTINAFAALGQGISEIFMMTTDNKMIALDNWEKSERAAIENSIGSEAVKKKRFEELDKQAAEKRTELQRQAAKENKAAAIFDSIIGTAAAVTQALSLPVPFNFIMAGIVGAMGAAKTALIAAQPIPLAEGGIVEGGQGGVQALVGEGRESELVLPMETGVAMLARNLRDSFVGMMPAMAPTPAAAGAGGGAVHFHIGTLIADDRGIKELERRQLQFRISEQQRKGQ